MKSLKYIATTIEEFLNEQIENVELYHGSNSSFDTFDDVMFSTGEGSDLFGKGYYLTDNPDVAEFYAKLRATKDRIKTYSHGTFGIPTPVYHKDADAYAEKNKHINVFSIHGNILDVENYILDDKFINDIRESFRKNSGWGDEAYEIFDKTLHYLRNNKSKINNYRGELLYIIDRIVMSDNAIMNDIIDHIKKSGYDGIKYKPDKNFEGNHSSYNYVIYNKNVITPKK